MSDTKFTPGPWRVIDEHQFIAVQRGRSGGFAVEGLSLEQARADANLIAASPDLYAALEDLIAYVEDGYGDDESNEGMAAHKALKKARGE